MKSLHLISRPIGALNCRISTVYDKYFPESRLTISATLFAPQRFNREIWVLDVLLAPDNLSLKNYSVMQYLYDWVNRKIQARRRRLREAARASGEFRRHTGGRTVFGQLTLSAVPAAEFSYVSRVIWPSGEQAQIYEDCVVDGILDILMVNYEPVLGMTVTLEEFQWEDIASCPLAYGMAAREAMEKILSPEIGAANYEYIDFKPLE